MQKLCDDIVVAYGMESEVPVPAAAPESDGSGGAGSASSSSTSSSTAPALVDKLKAWVPFGMLGGSSASAGKDVDGDNKDEDDAGSASGYQVLLLFVLEMLRYDLEWDDEDLWNRQVLRL